MYTLGIDIGLRNFGVCKLRTQSLCIVDLKCIGLNITQRKKFKESYAVASLFQSELNLDYIRDVSQVYIETPVPRARKTYWSLYNLLHYHFEHVLSIPCTGVAPKCKYDPNVYSLGNVSIPENKRKLTYRDRKKESIKLFEALQDHVECEQTFSKKDDVADAYLVAYYGLKCAVKK